MTAAICVTMHRSEILTDNARMHWTDADGLIILAERNENVNELSEASHGGSATRGLRVKR